MQITANTTPFLAEPFVFTDKHARKHCVVVVKGTFAVGADGECRSAAEPVPFVFADEHHGDPGKTSIRYECDFAPVKPRAEVLLNASAVVTSGRAVTQLEVGVAGPGLVKKALVTGDRFWVDSPRGPQSSDPQPFVTLPIVWDRAFGGSDLTHERASHTGSDLRNLVGVGFHLNGRKETIVGKPLPNIERPGNTMRVWSDKPEPIGFGPVGRGWRPRVELAGTYDQRWIDETFPFLPEDFDERYFQSAPLDQQLSELRTGATFHCLNMSEAGRFVVRVPSFDVPVRFLFDDRTEDTKLSWDTLILEPGVGRVIMLGRKSVPLPRKFTRLREIQIGLPKRALSPGKPYYKSLGEAVSALRRRTS